MKIQNCLPVFAAAIGVVALSFDFGCSKSSSSDSPTTVEAVRSDGQAVRADGTKVVVTVPDTNVTAAAIETWDGIKDFTYDRRADFSAGIDRLSKDMDGKADMYRSKAAGTPDAIQSERDSAMKDYDDARADLKAKRADLDNVTADTWASAKDKTGKAWENTKAAYEKVSQLNGGT
jgi:hypothetical protein